jgi:hypothetical protein
MAVQSLNTLKNWFKTGLKPSQAQFWDTWDSFRHKSDKVPVADIEGIDELLMAKASQDVLENHLTTPTAHAALFGTKEDKTNKGSANGYAPLDAFIKLSSQYLNIVNDLVTGGSTSMLSAEQGIVLKLQIDAINTLLSSNDINLDTVQELVNAIKTVQISLSTILVNDLTTGGTAKALTAEMGKSLKALCDSLSTNKVDKVEGERLINAAEITKLSGLVNVTTTIKPILSTVLTTQNVAGFVTYINALTPVLVVGANEIVKYNTTDTGRVFQLNLRGRSFGVGQPTIVATDVIEITDFLNKDLKLSNYPSTRNDGQLPTNKVLAPDVNGNIKLYTIATAPAPYMEVLIPDSTLPSTTTNFIIKGAFFTPTMTVAITGQTINYIIFVSDNLIKVNVTTGATEGLFAVTLNNGLSATFNNALMIVLGTVFSPLTADWISKTGAITITDSKVETLSYTSVGSAVWNRQLDWTKNFEVRCKPRKTPLGVPIGYMYSFLQLLNASDNSNKLNLTWNHPANYVQCRIIFNAEAYADSISAYSAVSSLDAWNNQIENTEIKIRWLNGVFTFWHNGVLKKTFSSGLTQNVILKASVYATDLYDIKYIELST